MAAELPKSLLQRACSLLARRAYSRGEMRDKLSKLAPEGEVEPALDRLEELKLLNDEEYAYSLAFNRMKMEGWGPIKVRHSLLRRQVIPDLIERAINRVLADQDERLLLGDYLDKLSRRSSLPQDRRQIRRLILHLKRRGFHDETVYSALRQKIPATAWQRFDEGE